MIVYFIIWEKFERNFRVSLNDDKKDNLKRKKIEKIIIKKIVNKNGT